LRYRCTFITEFPSSLHSLTSHSSFALFLSGICYGSKTSMV